jgi:hypothetical protein
MAVPMIVAPAWNVARRKQTSRKPALRADHPRRQRAVGSEFDTNARRSKVREESILVSSACLCRATTPAEPDGRAQRGLEAGKQGIERRRIQRPTTTNGATRGIGVDRLNYGDYAWRTRGLCSGRSRAYDEYQCDDRDLDSHGSLWPANPVVQLPGKSYKSAREADHIRVMAQPSQINKPFGFSVR